MKSKTEYHRYLKSDQWRDKREQAFRIHGRRCNACGSRKRLEINHLHYKTLFNEDPATDLEVLCSPCHRQHHGLTFRRRHESALKFAKRSKKFRRVFGGPAITMDQYRATRANPYLTDDAKRYRR